MCIAKGTKIKTNYGERTYIIKAVSGPCNCPRNTDELGYTKTGMHKTSPDHFHFVMKDASGVDRDDFYLNGYKVIDGRIKNVWCDDEIEILGVPAGTQLEMFI